MTSTYMFDMDGPLTLSKQPIGELMVGALYRLRQARRRLVLVTGAKYEQAEKQLGRHIKMFSDVHTESGNSYKEVWDHHSLLIAELMDRVSRWTHESAGPQMSLRRGCFNFAVCGQDADREVREAYAAFDAKTGDRLRMALAVAEKYPEVEVTIGGSVSVDGFMRGCGKSQIPVSPDTTFFCDSLGRFGADTALAEKVARYGYGTVVYAPEPSVTISYLDRERL